MDTMIEVRNLHKSFGQLEVLKGIDLEVQTGEIVSIVGPSGAGKTTLLQIIGTLDRADSGEVTIGGRLLSSLKGRRQARFRGEHIGFVFQFHQLLQEFSALENVMLPALITGKSRRAARNAALELIEFFGLQDRAGRRPNELSGGENQRVAVARALINNPQVLLADEPSGSLDSQNKAQLHKLFFDLRDRYGTTIVVVTHDTELASLCDRTIKMKDGRIEDAAPTTN